MRPRAGLAAEYEVLCFQNRQARKRGEQPESYFKIKCSRCKKYFRRRFYSQATMCYECQEGMTERGLDDDEL